MKGHKEHRAKGGETGGYDAAAADLEDKPEERTNAKKIDAEAHERKSGGRAKAHKKGCECKKCKGGEAVARKRGGHVEHKEVGKVAGEHAKHRVDRMPRKSGGRTGSDQNPFTSARHGTAPTGRRLDMEMD